MKGGINNSNQTVKEMVRPRFTFSGRLVRRVDVACGAQPNATSRARVLIPRLASPLAALSSPWALTSPSSSEFETISDTEIVLNPPPIAAGSQLSGLSRSLSARRDSRPDAESTASTPEVVQQRNRMASYRADYSEVEVERDGDDEYSAVEEDDMRGRGRGRTRMRDDPAIRRSILDDALRSR